MKESAAKIALIVTQEGLEEIRILGGDWGKRDDAIRIYNLIKPELESFRKAVERKLSDHGKWLRDIFKSSETNEKGHRSGSARKHLVPTHIRKKQG